MSNDAPVKLTHNEQIKNAIPTLAGTIAATIADGAADHFSDDDNQFLKFHGSYQQDDRDLRKTGKKYIMMIRGRIPGGVMTANQWAVFDDLATRYGNNTLRITTQRDAENKAKHAAGGNYEVFIRLLRGILCKFLFQILRNFFRKIP